VKRGVFLGFYLQLAKQKSKLGAFEGKRQTNQSACGLRNRAYPLAGGGLRAERGGLTIFFMCKRI